MKNRPATIKDIARKLRISVSTVSRSLRNFQDVNPETKEAVLDMAAKLQYQPNLVAMSLVNKRTNNIGIIIPSFVIYYYASAISGIQDTAAKAGYNIMVCNSNESYDNEVQNVKALTASRVDGLIVSLSKETENFQHLLHLQEIGTPLILFNRVRDDLNVSCVVVDDYEGAYKAVEHLIQTGSKRIAHIAGPTRLLNTNNRLNGYLDALEKNGISVENELIVHGDFTLDNGRECMKQLLQLTNPPDAIFCVNDSAAFGAMFEIKSQGLKIPEDIAIVGFTNEPLTELVEPSLTSVAQPIYEVGQRAAELFIARIKNKGASFIPEKVILKTKLIIRNSSMKIRR